MTGFYNLTSSFFTSILVTIILVFTSISARSTEDSQYPKLDSLESVFNTTTDQRVKVRTAQLILQFVEHRDQDIQKKWMEKIEAYGREINDRTLELMTTRLHGTYHNDRQEYLTAIGYFEKATKIAIEIKDSSELGNAYNDMGLALRHLGDHSKALENFYAGLRIREAQKDSVKISGSFNNIGMVFGNLAQTEKALEYFHKSLEIKKELKDRKTIAQTYNNIALVYEEMQDFDNALKYYEESNRLCYEINEQFGIALTLSNMGGVYGMMGNYPKSIELYNQAIPIQLELNKPIELAFSYKGLARVYLLMKQYDKAEEFALKTLELAEMTHAKYLIAEISGVLCDINKAQGDYKSALKYLEQNKTYNDSINSEESSSMITKIEMEYAYQKKLMDHEREMEEQTMTQEKKYHRQTYQLNLLIGAFLFLFALIVIILFNRRKLKLAKQIADNANVAKSEFLTNMSHEIRTPLNAVIGFSDLLIRTELREDQKLFTTTIHESAHSLLDIINDVLDFSKIEAGKMDIEWERVDLLQLKSQIQTIMSFPALQKNLKLEFSIDDNIPRYVQADGIRLRQILVNLVGNAIKFTSRGTVSLKCEIMERPTDNKVTLRFSVIDTGIGIPSGKQKKIFQAFSQADSSTTREYGGTGLGLSISNKLLALMGSSLKLISEVGKGSNFYFDITLNAYSTTTISPEEWSSVNSTSGMLREVFTDEDRIVHRYTLRILIAEDNPVNMLLAKTLLLDIYPSAEIMGADNGPEAIELFKTFAPDIVFMDVQMPNMNGYEVTHELRKLDPDGKVIIIALTAGTVEGEKERCLKAGMNDYISKPIMRVPFTEVIKRWVDKSKNH